MSLSLFARLFRVASLTLLSAIALAAAAGPGRAYDYTNVAVWTPSLDQVLADIRAGCRKDPNLDFSSGDPLKVVPFFFHRDTSGQGGIDKDHPDWSYSNITKSYYDELKGKWDKLPNCKNFIPVFRNGLFVGLYFVKVSGGLVSTERFLPTGQLTNIFHDTHDPVGVGVQLGYALTPWNNSVVVAPFVSADVPNISVYHRFATGSYLGTTSKLSGTAGVKVGPAVSPSLWIYGLAGVSALNQTMKINFIPAFSSSSVTVAGGTVGAGFAWHPNTWQIANLPLSLFAEYQHTWWQDANFNAPAASPAFTYNFRRQDDVIKVGINIALGGSSAPSRSYAPVGLPVKAPALK